MREASPWSITLLKTLQNRGTRDGHPTNSLHLAELMHHKAAIMCMTVSSALRLAQLCHFPMSCHKLYCHDDKVFAHARQGCCILGSPHADGDALSPAWHSQC